MRYILLLAICLIITSCGKEECEGINSVAFTFKDGTTGKGLANRSMDVNLVTFRGDGGIKERKTIANVKTNDTGYFYLEYPCQEEYWEVIELDAEDYSIRYMGIRGFPYEEHFSKTIYKSSLGTQKVYLNPKMPLAANDTIFLLWRERNGDGSINYEKLDTFFDARSGFWKEYRGKPGGGPQIHWGRGYDEYMKSFRSEGYKLRDQVLISGDPVIDSLVITY